MMLIVIMTDANDMMLIVMMVVVMVVVMAMLMMMLFINMHDDDEVIYPSIQLLNYFTYQDRDLCSCRTMIIQYMIIKMIILFYHSRILILI